MPFSILVQTLRRLRRSPAFALTATLTIALGIAANVVVFGVLDALLLQPLPIRTPGQVYFVQHPEQGAITLSFPQYQDIRRRNQTFSDVGVYSLVPVGLAVAGHAQQRWAYLATGSYFDLLGVKPLLGRFFSDADDRRGPDGSPWAVLTYDTWKTDFAADPQIVGRSVLISRHPFTILGVAAPGFYGTERFLHPALWVDMWNEQQIEGYNYLDARNSSSTWVLARTRPGVTAAQAQHDLDSVATQLAHDYPTTDERVHFLLTRPGFIGDYFGQPLHAFLFSLMLMAALVLAAACANLGGLYAARAVERTREFAVRLALGSTRAHILRSIALESVSIALAGGLLGCLLATLLLRLLTGYRPPFDFPLAVIVDPGPRVYLFALLLSLAAGFLSSLIPARESRRATLQQAMRVTGDAQLGRRWTLRDLLLLVEVALCCVLITASYVSLRGLERSLHLPLGFEPAHVTLATYDLDVAGYRGADALRLNRTAAEQAALLPGVLSTAFTSDTPLNPIAQNSTDIYPPGTTDVRPANRAFNTRFVDISPGYFATAGTRLLAGRDFTWTDDKQAPNVAIVNQTFARMLYGAHAEPASNVLGLDRSFVGHDGQSHRIIAIAENGKYSSLNEEPAPMAFYSAGQESPTYIQLLVRTQQPATVDAPRRAAALSAILARLEPTIPLTSVEPWQAALAPVLFPARAATLALGTLGGFALLLAITGIFGLASYAVTRRMRELGIRVALGAGRAQVVRAALGRVGRLVLLGSAVGLALGVASARVLSAVVYGASATDPLVLAAVALTMAAVGMLSAALPARRALTADPALLMRDE